MKPEIILTSNCGATLGKFILVIERNPVDLRYSEKVKNNLLRTSSPIYLYSIKPIRVTNVGIVETANKGKFAEYNNDAALRIPLITGDTIDKLIPKPTADSVREAILKYETNKERIIFIDYPALVKEIAALNKESEDMATSMANELMNNVKSLRDATLTEISACKSAMEDEGVDISSIFG